jgi:hypothetical protein
MTAAQGLHWHAYVAHQGRDHLVAMEFLARGILGHLPMRFERLTVGGRRVSSYALLMPPYGFVRFATASPEEYAFVLETRGLSHVLLDTDRRPAIIDDAVVAGHVEREYAERHNAALARAKYSSCFELGASYVVRSGPSKGHIGRLIAVHRGKARLDCPLGVIVVREDELERQGGARLAKAA